MLEASGFENIRLLQRIRRDRSSENGFLVKRRRLSGFRNHRGREADARVKLNSQRFDSTLRVQRVVGCVSAEAVGLQTK